MYRTNIDILISAKCLDSPCTGCFLLPSCSTFNGMFLLMLSCYCCYYPSYCFVVVCFAPWCLVSSRLFPRLYLSHRIVACLSLCTRNSFFIPPFMPPRLSVSLRSSVSSRDGSHPKLFRTLSSSGDSRAFCFRGSFEVNYQFISREGPYQSVDHP